MRLNLHFACLIACLAFISIVSCRSAVKEQTDSMYSRHLQRQVDLRACYTPMSDDKSDINLLLILNESERVSWKIQSILDSLHEAKAINPLLVVITEGHAREDFGLSEWKDPSLPGKKSAAYSKFIINELLPLIKKKARVRKFLSTAILGSEKAGIAAFDLAWQHDEKFPRVGIFSASWQDWKRNPADSSAVFEYLDQSRKRPRLEYWLYAGGRPDSTNRILTEQFVSRLSQKSFVRLADIQLHVETGQSNQPEDWNRELPAFLVWAFGK